MAGPLESITLRPGRQNITVRLVTPAWPPAWPPAWRDSRGQITPAWR